MVKQLQQRTHGTSPAPVVLGPHVSGPGTEASGGLLRGRPLTVATALPWNQRFLMEGQGYPVRETRAKQATFRIPYRLRTVDRT